MRYAELRERNLATTKMVCARVLDVALLFNTLFRPQTQSDDVSVPKEETQPVALQSIV